MNKDYMYFSEKQNGCEVFKNFNVMCLCTYVMGGKFKRKPKGIPAIVLYPFRMRKKN